MGTWLSHCEGLAHELELWHTAPDTSQPDINTMHCIMCMVASTSSGVLWKALPTPSWGIRLAKGYEVLRPSAGGTTMP